MPEPHFPDLAHQELYESLLDAFLLSQTSSDFAKTFLSNVVPLQQLVSALAAANPRKVTDGVTTANSTTATSASAQFQSFDQGRPITGGSLPAGTTISTVTDAQTVTVSQPASADGTGVSLTIG